MKVSGTIILGEKKQNSFLVMKGQPTVFPFIEESDESKTALGVILNYYRDELGIDPDALRLEELTMVHDGGAKQTLFVFSINSKIKSIQAICEANESLEFTDVTLLEELFKTVEIDTAPTFS